jgi:hypothetical protein
MAYRFKLNEPMERGFERIAGEQLDRAIAHLEAATGTDAAAVHETRKDLKRIRALLRLVRPALAGETFKDVNRALRDVGRSLSVTRDIDVLEQLVMRLVAAGDLKAAIAARLRKAFVAARLALATDAQRSLDVADLVTRLQNCRETIEKAELDFGSAGLYTTGLAHCFENCRTMFDDAFSRDDAAIHAWRKSVQLHWRHMQLVSAAWPEYCNARIAEARAISALIGEERDLGMLQAFANSSAVTLTPAMLSSLEPLVTTLRRPLQTQARLRAERLLAEGTAGLCRRIETYWEAAVALKRLPSDASEPAT